MIYTLTGEITAKVVDDAMVWMNQQVKSGDKEELIFYLSSTGGDIDSSIRLYDFLKALPNSVVTVGIGQVDSSAILIFLAGDKRTALKDCRFRFHEASYTTPYPTASLQTHEEVIGLFREIDRRYKEIIAKETKKSGREVKQLFTKGKIVSAEQAKNFGIVQNIVGILPCAAPL